MNVEDVASIAGAARNTVKAAGTIGITLKLFATLSSYLPEGAQRNQIALEIPRNSTIDDVTAPLHMPPRLVSLVVVNGEFVPLSERGVRQLVDGDVLAIWPPVAGG